MSRTTVSMVMNEKAGSIPERTRQRVLQAAKKLGFVPSAEARTLRNGHGSTVLCLAPGWMPSGRADSMWNALSKQLTNAGLSCVFSRSAGTTTPLRQLLSDMTPGVVVPFFELSDDDRRLLKNQGIPIVEFWSPDIDQQPMPVFSRFQYNLGATQGKYITSLGCKRIGYIGANDPLGFGLRAFRIRGVEDALAQSGQKLTCNLEIDLTDFDSVHKALKVATEKRSDAICCFNDDCAAAVLACCKETGIEVPKDVKVIGVDNLSMGQYFEPSLTTVDFDHDMSEYVAEIKDAIDARRHDRQRENSGTPDEDDAELGPQNVWVVKRQSA
ncbi:LacI family DNA-binding transcriptional regulator [Bifidobacterium sp. ESL0800]|uniref:LacI family DNA-binding transcriptional regulator n=1 Tax=Bifidobacterium sp. ESL0800 TaxID=2983236 RepID=UPI0023F6D93A|nr:LacI family DNA-binding transcriptional regulator [Bifidobacterium sp. ESL0800]WEV75579.1 LacI family DNA-binding transcriptional regulator [Bifidobacterium sp. ESL0800]